MANDQETWRVTPPAGARCAQHPDVEAFTTCTRCGDYACANCIGLGSFGQCDACRSRTNTTASQPLAASLLRLYFGFNGRIGRRSYWLGLSSLWVGFITFFVAIGGIFGTVDKMDEVWLVPMSLLASWVWFALSVKRWHDRDKSANWVLIAMVPLIGGPWTLFECGCLRGTIGPNRYGEDPLGV